MLTRVARRREAAPYTRWWDGPGTAQGRCPRARMRQAWPGSADKTSSTRAAQHNHHQRPTCVANQRPPTQLAPRRHTRPRPSRGGGGGPELRDSDGAQLAPALPGWREDLYTLGLHRCVERDRQCELRLCCALVFYTRAVAVRDVHCIAPLRLGQWPCLPDGRGGSANQRSLAGCCLEVPSPGPVHLCCHL